MAGFTRCQLTDIEVFEKMINLELKVKGAVVMKHLLLFLLVFASYGLAAQRQLNTKDDYLRKGRRMESAAWILAGSGVAMVTVGTVLAVNTDWDALDYDDNSYGRKETIKGVGAIALIGTGVIASIGSIPLFIMSAKNKSKAASFTVSTQRYHSPGRSMQLSQQMPALTFRVQFR